MDKDSNEKKYYAFETRGRRGATPTLATVLPFLSFQIQIFLPATLKMKMMLVM
jgi:hypothetical protein